MDKEVTCKGTSYVGLREYSNAAFPKQEKEEESTSLRNNRITSNR